MGTREYHRAVAMRRSLWLLVGFLAVFVPATAHAQLFFASRAEPRFTIGPMILRASVTARLDQVRVNVLWSVLAEPGRSPGDLAQDLYLLWPGEVKDTPGLGKPDPALARFVEERKFSVIAEGRVPLFAQSLYDVEGEQRAELLSGGAPFVTFVQAGGALGLSPPATYIRVPWTPRMADRTWLMDLRMEVSGLIKEKRASWAENSFRGQRYLFTMSYNEVRDRPLFPMYFELRDRVVRLADAPSELIVHFSDSDRLKIDEVFPPTSIRRLSESLESTEVVSLFLDKSEGITPQHLSVVFGYSSQLQALGLVVASMLFLVLGYAIGPVMGRVALALGEAMAARVQVGWGRSAPGARQTGVVLARDIIQRIVPGQTTYEEVLRFCGPDVEEHQQLAPSHRRTLVCRGRRLLPQGRRVFGWLATVRHWEVEHHEVRIELEGDVVRDIQASLRRARSLAATVRSDS